MHLASIAPWLSIFVSEFIAHVPRADELMKQCILRNLRFRFCRCQFLARVGAGAALSGDILDGECACTA
jgi:hypothetical protein